MKPVLQLLTASALATGMVLGGVVMVSAALSPEEEQHQFTGLDIRDLWTSKPVRVDRAAQNLERLPPRYATNVVMAPAQSASNEVALEAEVADLGSPVAGIDIISTGSVNDEGSDALEAALPAQHLAWCGKRYRSYDPANNTYRSFSGTLRDCTSPYLTDNAEEIAEDAELMAVNDGKTNSTDRSFEDANTSACMARYRSYRPSDNSYQPYGGGPRQQCQLTSL